MGATQPSNDASRSSYTPTDQSVGRSPRAVAETIVRCSFFKTHPADRVQRPTGVPWSVRWMCSSSQDPFFSSDERSRNSQIESLDIPKRQRNLSTVLIAQERSSPGRIEHSIASLLIFQDNRWKIEWNVNGKFGANTKNCS